MFNCIGLDISKRLIAVHIPKNSLDIEIENSLKGIRKLYSKLKKLYKKELSELVFIFEPTGSYSVALTKFCNEQNILCFIINPKQFSNYAKALGKRVKSDKIDAQVLSTAIHLARKGEVRVPYINPLAEEIKELMSYYKFISKQKISTQNHLEAIQVKKGNKYAIKDLKNLIDEYKQKESEILAEIKTIIDSNKELKEAYTNIISIPGIGKVGGIVLLHLFIKYPNVNQRQIISLAGLDPIDKSSGDSIQTKSKISKAGSKLYRGTLFIGVMNAIRYDDNFASFFNRLKSKGKHTTQAQIAVMRKMIIIAYSLYNNNTKYDKVFYQQATGGEAALL